MAIETTAISEKFVNMSHGKTRYFEAGSGYPTLLLHGAGFLSGADNWLGVMPGLAERLHCYSFDSLNWGPGDVFDQEFSFAYQVDHIREFMDVLGIEKANVVGHSMGGWLATLFAYESRERVNKLVLVAAGGSATRPLGIDADHILQQYLAKVADAEQTGGFAKVMKHMTNPMTRSRYNTLRRLPHITAPTLILWGRNDTTNALEMAEEQHAGIKGSKLTVYDDTGHGVPQERPKEFVRDVLAFL
jgi:pimeloyl-ACP methyl ester carboxylesterase